MNCEHLVLEKKDTKRLRDSVDFPRENKLGEIKTDESGEDPPTRGFVSSNRNPLRMITAKRREGIYNKDRGVVPRNPGQVLARPHREQNSERKIQQHLEQSLLLSLGAIWSVFSRSLCYASHIALCVWTVLFS